MKHGLSLDLGTKTGYCVFDIDNECYIYKKSGMRNFSKEKGGARFYSFLVFLLDLIKSENISKIYYESVCAHAGVKAAHMYGGFEAILLCVACSNDINIEGIGVTTIKRKVTGNGHATKDEILKSVNERLSTHIVDDNEGDAVAIMLAIGEK